MKKEITKKVSEFYEKLPFNYYESTINQTETIKNRNSILSYPNLHKLLSSGKIKSILDVGCGAGWFVNSVSCYYKIPVVGIDICKNAIKRAGETAKSLELNSKFLNLDLFNIPNNFGKFSLVNSIGVLHHTFDCKKALINISQFVDAEGYLHIGLYHKYGREPFLDLFKKYREKLNENRLQESELKEAFSVYKELNSNIRDEIFLYSWFRDQVLHVHETQHTFKEVYEWLNEVGFKVLSTSINKFKEIKNIDEIFELEKLYRDISIQRNIIEKKYFPGFFTLLARKNQ